MRYGLNKNANRWTTRKRRDGVTPLPLKENLISLFYPYLLPSPPPPPPSPWPPTIPRRRSPPPTPAPISTPSPSPSAADSACESSPCPSPFSNCSVFFPLILLLCYIVVIVMLGEIDWLVKSNCDVGELDGRNGTLNWS